MKVGIYTLGCKVNMYESEFVISELKKAGYEIASFDDVCDVYIINTCSVTNTSDSKSRKIIRQAVKRNKHACVVVMGCFIEANQDYKEDGVDIYLGNKDKSKIVELLDQYFKEKQEIRDLTKEEAQDFEDMFITTFDGRTRAFVKIQDGCRNFCSFCIIPYVRGRCRSKDFNKVIDEVRTLTDNGYSEIVLTGIHTGNYGVDIHTSFAKLLKELVKIEKLRNLRISSIEITELNDEVLDVIKNNDVIVDHLHIPLQAGSNKILKLMNRKYDLNYFREKIKKIRSIRPNISISTDIIVGFPGESEEDFLETISFSREIAFSKIHVFPYSVRKNTKAEKMEGHIDNSIKKDRARRLIDVSKELEKKYMEKFIGKEVDVLTETIKNGCTYGHTGNFLYVKINKELKEHTFIKVKLKGISYPYVIGEWNE
ncbi:MAG: tRNA (N(6)-L-threonylcarbamoyladenosine(37)-C(2))-methylthiotransferase MtaB [Bacilli bacterium]|nr:tRNA (N(6)-L-threonylcarbamoyladenosine(37)-C(2))-methylthiotransferase MtaB [Bacilli bacterium]